MTKLIIIGIDGATPDLMFRWMEEGWLPNFQKIKSNGVSGKLNSVPNQRSAAAWSSFITGVNPGKHGIFEFYERVPLSHDIIFTKASSRESMSFWKYLSEKNKKHIVVNVPMTYPAEPLNGCMISGLDAPGKTSPGFAYPPDLMNRVEQAAGPYIQEPGVTSMVMSGKARNAVDKIIESVRQRGKSVRYLMNEYEWDTLVAVFRETDPTQHCFWEDMEQNDSLLGNAVFNVYRQIDNEVGKILEKAGKDCRIMVMSDHGFGFRQHGTGCLNQWLEQAGFLKFKKKRMAFVSDILKFGYQALEKSLSRGMKERLFQMVPGLINKVQSRVFFASIDWDHTIAYGDNVMPVIWLNTSDISPNGVQKSHVEKVISDLKKELSENCRDAENHRPVIEWVKHREECYFGPKTRNAPDLLIRWKATERIAGLCYGMNGRPIFPRYPTREFMVNTGDHRPMGIFMAQGDGIKKNISVEGMDIVDVTAAAVYLNHLPVPEFMEGQIRHQMYEKQFLDKYPVKTDKQAFDQDQIDAIDYSEQDETALKERLRGLGYLE